MYTGLGVRPDEASGKRSRRGAFNGTVIALGLTSFFTDISSEMVAAVIPLFLTIELGFSPAAFGLFQGAYELANASLRLVGGAIADRTRRPKETAAAGYGLSTLTRAGLVGSALAGLPAVPFLIADRLGKGLRTGPRDAMISLATPQESWGTAFGVHRSLDAAGALLGPLIAAFLLWQIPGAFDAVFVVSFGFGLVGFSVIWSRVHNPRIESPTPTSSSLKTLTSHFGVPGFRRIFAVGLGLSMFTIGDALVYLVIWDASRQATVGQIGVGGFGMEWFALFFAATAVAFLATATPLGRLADRVGRGKMWITGHLALLAVYGLLLAGATTPITILSVLVLLGLYYGATDGVLPALASGVIPEATRASGLATLATGIAVGRMLSAAGFGLIWSALGADRALMIAAGGLIVALGIASTQAVLRRPQPE